MKKIIVATFLTLLFAPTITSAAFDTNLRYGSKGKAVIELQEFLTDKGFYKGPISGNFFSLTLASVKAFQKKEGIKPLSGMFGPLSRARANAILVSEKVEIEVGAPLEPITGPTEPVAPTESIKSTETPSVPISARKPAESIRETIPKLEPAPSVENTTNLAYKVINGWMYNMPESSWMTLEFITIGDSFSLEAFVVSASDKSVRERIYPDFVRVDSLSKFPLRECLNLESNFQEFSKISFPYPCPEMGYAYASKDWFGRDYYLVLLEKDKTTKMILPTGTRIEYIKLIGVNTGKVVEVRGDL